MKKIISYSLYGTNQIYHIGALRNAEMVSKYYPGFIARFYVGNSISSALCEQLMAHGAEVIRQNETEGPRATFWRFRAVLDENVDVILSRDCDSRLSQREVAATNAWLESGKDFHIMRDHPFHNAPILAGMWSAHTNQIRSLFCDIDIYEKQNSEHGIDQRFLANRVYPKIKSSWFIHDSFFKYELISKDFPHRRENYHYVGEAFNAENDINDMRAKKAIIDYDNFWLLRAQLKLRSFLFSF